MNDERLSELYQRAVAARARPRSGCVAPEAILAVVRRSAPEEERLATLDHVAGCRACGGELELLRALERAGAETGAADPTAASPGPPAPIPLRQPGWRRVVPLALAASLLAAGVAGVLQMGPGDDGAEVLRGGDEGVTLVAPGEEVPPGAPVRFAWEPVPGAARYVVEVLGPDGRVAWTAATADTTATLDDPRVLAPGVAYRWWVQVANGAGDRRASALRPLRLRRE